MKIEERIKKLLALATSSNPHEAAAAAGKAQALMLEHAISEDQIGPGDARETAVEEVGQEHMEIHVAYWRGIIASRLALTMMCRVYKSGGRLFIVGKPSARAAFTATFAYLCYEVERMAKPFWSQVPGYEQENTTYRVWANSFRAGAATTIVQRLKADMLTLTANGADTTSPTALVLRKTELQVSDWIRVNVGALGRGRSSAPQGSGFETGKVAGHGVNITRRAGSDRQLA